MWQFIHLYDLKIINSSTRCPGSTHDAYTWNHSQVLPFMENLHRQITSHFFFLLGDSGNPLRSYLITPYPDTVPNTPEDQFNTAHRITRSTIERCNGVLKLRFRCLLKHRIFHYSPERASKITNSCAVLHNMCKHANLPEIEMDPYDENLDFDMFNQANVGGYDVMNGNNISPLNE